MSNRHTKKHIVDNSKEAYELSQDCAAGYGNIIELSKEDIEALIQGKYLVWTGGEYSLVLVRMVGQGLINRQPQDE